LDGRSVEVDRHLHLAARDDDAVAARHERIVDHGQQIGEVDPLRVAETDDEERLVQGGDVPSDEGVGGVDHGHALEVDVRMRELRRDVVNVVVHAPQDGVCHGLDRVAPRDRVAVYLLDPLQIDDGHDADE